MNFLKQLLFWAYRPALLARLLWLATLVAAGILWLVPRNPEEVALYPSHDGVVWQETPEGFAVAELLPARRWNLTESSTAGDLKKGDILQRVDYRTVWTLGDVYAYTRSPRPGNLYVYTLLRTEPQTGQQRSFNAFHTLRWKPTGLPAESTLAWMLFLGLLALAIPGLVLLVLLVVPFLQQSPRSNYPLLVGLLLGFGACMLALGRLGLHAVDTETALLGLERAGAGLLGLVWGGLAVLLVVQAPSPGRISRMMGVGAALLVAAVHLDLLWFRPAIASLDAELWALWGSLVGGICLVYLPQPNPRMEPTVSNSTFRLGVQTLLLALPLGLWAYALTMDAYARRTPDTLLQLWLVALFFVWAWPLIRLSQPQFQVGNRPQAGLRALGYFLLVLTLTLGWLVVHFTFQPLLKNPLLLGLAELFTLMLLAALLRNLWLRVKPLLMRYFRSPAQQRAFAMAQLQSELARITHSDDLVSKLEERLAQLLELDTCTTYIGDEVGGLLATFQPEELNALARQLVDEDEFWADAKVLNEWEVDGELENRLHTAGIALLLPIRRGRGQPGLLAVGHKRNAQLTLDEVQQLSRLCLQVGLTLEVLVLLETEQDLMRQTMEANLTALRAQINPHFLFNTLNSISELVHSNPKQAEEAIERLAFIFRYTNKFSSEQFVTLENELSLVRSYLEIEKIRFGEGFELEVTVDKTLLARMIPAFVLQTVMENAVKHGVSKVVPPKRIRLSLAAEGAGCVLEVEDNGPGIDLSRVRASTGLNNVLHRMETLYGRGDLLEFHNTGRGTLVRIHLPG